MSTNIQGHFQIHISVPLIYNVFHLSSLCMLVSMTMLQFENALTCSLISQSHFFQVHQIASDIVPNLYNKQ